MKAVVIHVKKISGMRMLPNLKRGGRSSCKVGRCGICAIDPKIFHGSAFFQSDSL